jgi:hypothetical protein
LLLNHYLYTIAEIFIPYNLKKRKNVSLT